MSTRHSARLSVANRSPSTLPASAAVWRASLNRSIASRLEPAKWSASPRIPSASTSNERTPLSRAASNASRDELDRRAEPAAPELDGREPAQHLRPVARRRVGPDERRRLFEGALCQREVTRVPQELAIVGPQGPRTRRVARRVDHAERSFGELDGPLVPSDEVCRPRGSDEQRRSRRVRGPPGSRSAMSASTRSCSSSAVSQWSSAEVDARSTEAASAASIDDR